MPVKSWSLSSLLNVCILVLNNTMTLCQAQRLLTLIEVKVWKVCGDVLDLKYALHATANV